MKRDELIPDPESAPSLRERAEALLRSKPAGAPTMSNEDVQALVHELNVRQVELEIQNEELRESRAELAHALDRYVDLYESAPVGYTTLDKDGRILEANLAAARLVGAERQELLGSRLSRFVRRESLDDLYLHWREVLSRHDKQRVDIELDRADGARIVARLESLAFDAEGERYVRTALIDITDKRRAREKLRASEQRYHRLIESAIDYIFTVRVENGVAVETIHGPDCEAFTGFSPNEFAADNVRWESIIPREDREAVENHVRQTLVGERPAQLEHRLRHKDGAVRWVLRVTSPYFDEQGSLVSYDVLLRDITERKVAEDALRKLNSALGHSLSDRQKALQRSVDNVRLLTEALAKLGEGVLITKDEADWPGSQILFVNEPLCRITGYKAEELIGQSLRILGGDDSKDETLDWIGAELSNGRSVRTELTSYRKDGAAYEAELSITPLLNTEGRRTHFVSILRDITEGKRAENALREREELLRAVLNAATDAILNIDQVGVITDANPATERMFGYRQEELIGQNVKTLMPQAFMGEDNGRTVRYLKTGEALIMGVSREVAGKRRDGETFPCELAVSEVDHLGFFTCVVRDISERKEIELSVTRVSEEEKKNLARELHDGLCQELAGLAYSAKALTTNLTSDDHAKSGEMQRLCDGLLEATQHARQLSHGFSPVGEEPTGLMNALQRLTSTCRELYKIQCRFMCRRQVQISDAQSANHLYRIAQEALNNAIRHGKASRVTITLVEKEGWIVLKILDNGGGLRETPSSADGIGVQVMKYRAATMHGRITLKNRKPRGVEVRCSVPAFPSPDHEESVTVDVQ